MIKILFAMNALFYGTNERHHYKQTNKLLWAVCNVGFRCVWSIMYYYMKLKGALRCLPLKSSKVNSELIVSLTTFPARINDVWMVIDSIFRQKMCPSAVCLYLSEEEFPEKEKGLPSLLKRYQSRGLQIHWVSDNLKPHQKYFYALQEYPDKCVVTIDDDVYYPNGILQYLWELHLCYPGAVCAHRATPILDRDMVVKPYIEWGRKERATPGCSHNSLALGVGGVLYPAGILRESSLFDVATLKSCCLRADDLWLKCHEVLNGVPVATGNKTLYAIEVSGSQRISLKDTNVGSMADNGNDVQWCNLNNKYDINKQLIELVKGENNEN